MCQSLHSPTAGERYSLFQLTAGLSPATGEHAGKWVTVNTVCLPHICSTSTMSTPRKCMTPRQRTKETVSKCAASLQKNHCSCFAESRRSEMTRGPLHHCHVSSMTDYSSSEWKPFRWSRGWWSRPSVWWLSGQVNTRVMKQDWGTLLEAIKAISKMKKLLPGSMCVLPAGRPGLPTWLQRERAGLKEGGGVVLLEHDSWIWAGKSMVISNLATFLRTPG